MREDVEREWKQREVSLGDFVGWDSLVRLSFCDVCYDGVFRV
jgi:hypothetical protein